MRHRHPHISRFLLCAWALTAIGLMPARTAIASYGVVAGSAHNSIHLSAEAREGWRVTAELVSRPSWISRANLTCTTAESGADVRVIFDVSDQAPAGAHGTLIVALQAVDQNGKRVVRSLRRVPLTLTATAPEIQQSFQIEECCIPIAGIDGARDGRPDRFLLLGAVPNPWQAATAFRFGLPTAASASLRVLDLAGRVVWEARTPRLQAGYHQITWDGRDGTGRRAPPGLYFYKVVAGPWQASGKALRLR